MTTAFPLRLLDGAKRHGVILLAMLFTILTLLQPLGSVLEMDGDEHFELTKAFLVYRGHHLYTDIWDDQPPLHTALLAAAFCVFGPSALVARVFASLFGFLLVLSTYACVRLTAGRAAGLFAAGWLYCVAAWPNLFHAATLEAPAVGLGVASAALALGAVLRGHRLTLSVLSGALLGVTAQLKFTGLLVGFIGGAVLLWPELAGGRRVVRRSWLSPFAAWVCSAAATFTVLAAVLPTVDYQAMYLAHTSEPPDPEHYSFSAGRWFGEWTFLLPVGGALGASWVTRRMNRVILPLAMLSVLALVHSLHRPFWAYYLLHFAVPLAWLCGVLASDSLGALRRLASGVRSPNKWTDGPVVLGAAVCLCVVVAEIASRYAENWARAQRLPKVSECRAVALLKAHCQEEEYAFTPETAVAFAAQRMTLPWLSVLVAKRYWCGAISERQIRTEVERLRPAVVLLASAELNGPWLELLGRGYRKAGEAEGLVLYRCNGGQGGGEPTRREHAIEKEGASGPGS